VGIKFEKGEDYEITTDYHKSAGDGHVQIQHGADNISPVFGVQDDVDIQVPQRGRNVYAGDGE
jgi:hypothetical protein